MGAGEIISRSRFRDIFEKYVNNYPTPPAASLLVRSLHLHLRLLYSTPRFSSPIPVRQIVLMDRTVKKLKVSARHGIVTPHTTTTSHSQPSRYSKRDRSCAHNSVHHRSYKDHTTTEPPTKRSRIASSKSTASQRASIDNLDYDNVPDVPETDLPALQEVWRQARIMPSPPLVSSHIFLSDRHIYLTVTLSRLLLLRR
jgi:hypothetical protein